MACANCHGFDGRGKPEGGVLPSNITWEELTKSYGHTYAGGRWHPAYAEHSLAQAIIDGVDPAGTQLAAAMPKYRMSREDLADLLAYLKRLADDSDPGITDTSIKVGTLLPMTGPLAEIGGWRRPSSQATSTTSMTGAGSTIAAWNCMSPTPPDASSIGAQRQTPRRKRAGFLPGRRLYRRGR